MRGVRGREMRLLRRLIRIPPQSPKDYYHLRIRCIKSYMYDVPNAPRQDAGEHFLIMHLYRCEKKMPKRLKKE